ncbi:uncharacterized protein BDR25DRAFT_308520 [Lindgomyces ingoldianus]|uniref:Uncharacterized protein n=1 Tax=Lindgomyces ingoldianus TaxID=673940 RepID=A0ACB6RFX7_9PLEO|nr:uncharacterized protein BDR25DRAFT_308520 [Lindgomyces ingoldianus]KAF2477625.1 hypothetical protein BDR25DRAFT_308520 [Lindgomyces ingoldianus]
MKPFVRPDGTPLVSNDPIVLFGLDPLQPATEHWVYLLKNGFKAFTWSTVQVSPVPCAASALQFFDERVDKIFLHFDIDVIDSGFERAMECLGAFLGSEKVVGMVGMEVNPNNDPEGRMSRMFADGIVKVFEGRHYT